VDSLDPPIVAAEAERTRGKTLSRGRIRGFGALQASTGTLSSAWCDLGEDLRVSDLLIFRQEERLDEDVGQDDVIFER
jgi:hypothetical protein